MVVNLKNNFYFWGLNFNYKQIQLFIIYGVGGSLTFVQPIVTPKSLTLILIALWLIEKRKKHKRNQVFSAGWK